MKKATQQQTKVHNRNLVLTTILARESISRAEIARVTSLTRTTVSDIVADLIDAGLIQEIGVGSSLGGKSPILLSAVEDARYLIGLDLGPTQFSGGVVNLRGDIRKMVSLPIGDCNGDSALELVYDIIDRLLEPGFEPLVGIGVGAPGLVDTTQGIVLNAVNLDWQNLPLGRLLKDRYQLPVIVVNDSQAAALGEYTYGKDHKPDAHLIVINARHGIGAGVVINGHLFHGDGGGAGEIGHVVVVSQNGLPCRCGNHGCLETVASSQAIVKRAQILMPEHPSTSLPQTITLESLEKAFSAGDPLAHRVVTEAGHYLGLAISGLVGMLNIQRIVLTGDMTRFGDEWLKVIQETMVRSTLFRLAHDTRVEIGELDSSSIILGASAILSSNFSLLFNQ